MRHGEQNGGFPASLADVATDVLTGRTGVLSGLDGRSGYRYADDVVGTAFQGLLDDARIFDIPEEEDHGEGGRRQLPEALAEGRAVFPTRRGGMEDQVMGIRR